MGFPSIDFKGAAKSVYHGAKAVAKPLAPVTSMVGDPYLAASVGEKAKAIYDSVGNPTGVKKPNIDKSAFSSSEEQKALIAQIQARAAGLGVSPAELQQRHAFEQAMAQQRAIAASARGVNPALANRTAAYNVGNQQQALAGQSAILRAQEQADAERELAMLLAQQQQAGMAGAQFDFQQYQAMLQQAQAQRAQNMQLLGIGAQTLGTVGGMMVGGPPGAMAGGAGARALAGAYQPQQASLGGYGYQLQQPYVSGLG